MSTALAISCVRRIFSFYLSYNGLETGTSVHALQKAFAAAQPKVSLWSWYPNKPNSTNNHVGTGRRQLPGCHLYNITVQYTYIKTKFSIVKLFVQTETPKKICT